MKILIKGILAISFVVVFLSLMYFGCIVSFTLTALTAHIFSYFWGKEKIIALVSGIVYSVLTSLIISLPTIGIFLIIEKLYSKKLMIYKIAVMVNCVIFYIAMLYEFNYI